MSRPNVLLVFSDQEQAPALTGDLDLPHRERLAARGVTFSHAFCTTPQCTASRASIMTGRYPQEVGVVTNIGAVGSRPLSPDFPTLGSVFRAAGYVTGYLGKWHLSDNEMGPLDAFGFPGRTRLRGDDLEQAVVNWLSAAPDEPWLLVVSIVNPHDVYSMPEDQQIRPDVQLPANFNDDVYAKPACQQRFLDYDQGARVRDFDEKDWLRYISWYHDLIEKVDRHFGAVLNALEASGQADETLVAYTSDHGDMAGGHGLPYKGPFMYEEILRVPLVVSWPDGVREGETRDGLVSLVDLAPTFAAAAGVEWPVHLPGRDLRHLASDADAPWRDRVFAQYHSKQRWSNPVRTIRTERWKLNEYVEDRDELYDLQDDPGELRNQIHSLEHSDLICELRAGLHRWREDTLDPLL